MQKFLYYKYADFMSDTISDKAIILEAIGAKQSKDGDYAMLLMSAKEFSEGGSKICEVPICVTPDGKEPIEPIMEGNYDSL